MKYEEGLGRPWWQDVALSVVRRQASGTWDARVESREVKRPGQRGIDRDCDYAAQKACAR